MNFETFREKIKKAESYHSVKNPTATDKKKLQKILIEIRTFKK